MSEADNKSKSFLQLILDEIRKIFTGGGSDKEPKAEKEDDIPQPSPKPAPLQVFMR